MYPNTSSCWQAKTSELQFVFGLPANLRAQCRSLGDAAGSRGWNSPSSWSPKPSPCFRAAIGLSNDATESLPAPERDSVHQGLQNAEQEFEVAQAQLAKGMS